MKKILLTMVMVLMMASPVMAGTPTMINGVGRNLETVNVDNHLYLPLRTIAEIFNMDVQWDGTFVRINSAKRPVITGDDKFKSMVTQALDLLQANDPMDYEMVCENTKEIYYIDVVSTKYGIDAYAGSDGKSIFIAQEMTNSSRYTPVCIAGTLVHESTHNYNFNTNVGRGSNQDEKIAYLREINTLRTIGASQQEVQDVEDVLKWVTTH